jgi:serine/threonine protein kinase/Tfp pilus assembly protein PilF
MLSSGPEPDVLGPIAEDFLQRFRRGERPALTEYAARYPELAEEIRELFPALVLMEDVRPGPKTVVGAAAEPAGVNPLWRLGEFRIVREIGRGGMGVVYEAEQESLGRRVALKVLPPRAPSDSQLVERFRREAKAAARLHHTNIVPVFGVGEEGGNHFYVMQYIEGCPLDKILAELRRLRGEPGRPESSPTETEADVRPDSGASSPAAVGPPLVSPAGPTSPCSSSPFSDPQRPFSKSVAHMGAQAADALEYAATQGVLHRDVKPSNLLLDVWGNVWLTDFGLAKATGTPDLTRTGDLLGTLRYMAPERLRGRADVRSDVYSLGLTLYEMLALRPAFTADSQGELLHRITSTEPPRLDRLDPSLPRDLVTVVHKAMAKDPADRYPTPRELADDLRRFLDDRSILARRVRLPEQAWRWCRRNPTMAALVAALLALLLLATGSWLWFEQQQAERRGRAREAVEAALAQVPGLRRQGRWPEAHAVLDQARSRLDDARSEELRQRLIREQEDLDLAATLEQIRLTPAIEDGRFDYPGMSAAYARAFAQAGLDVRGDEEEAAARLQVADLRPELVVALDHWALVADALGDGPLRGRLLRLARQADPDPEWGDRFREPAVWEDRARLRRLAEEAQQCLDEETPDKGPTPPLLTLLAKKLGQKEGEAEPLLRAAQRRHPEDFWLNFALGEALRERKPAEAVGFYRAALATRPAVAEVHHEVGMALYRQGQYEEAIPFFHRAIDLKPRGAFHNNLALCLLARGQLEKAIAEFHRASEMDPGSPFPHFNLGLCLHSRRRLDEALTALQRAVELDPRYALAHYYVGWCLQDKGRLDEAMTAYRRSIVCDPAGAAAHNNLGTCLQTRGQMEEAMTEYRRAMEIDPKFTLPHNNLGMCLQARGSLEEAMAEYRRAIAIDPEDALGRNKLGACLYAAACAAIRSAAGQGSGEARLDEAERAGLRRQALNRLRECLELRTRLLQGGNAVSWPLWTWPTDAALASVRDPAALATLSDAERELWQRLWADVAALLVADPLEQSRGHAAHREWAPAADCYARALKDRPTDDGEIWFEYAAVLLLSGDRKGYAQTCAHMVEKCDQETALRAYLVARACTLAPDSVADAELPGRLADKELTAWAGEFWSLTEQGALHYRAGRFAQAVPLFEQSLRADAKPGRAVLSWLWLALAQRRLDKPEEARHWLDQACGWLDQYRDGMPNRAEELGLHLHNWLEAHVLRREAEALLGQR